MNARPLPVMTATNQPYGQAGQQAAGQKIVPLSPPPTAASVSPAEATPTTPAYTPGQHDFGRPSERPDEHILTPAGGATAPDLGSLASALHVLAAQSGSTEMASLATRAMQMSN